MAEAFLTAASFFSLKVLLAPSESFVASLSRLSNRAMACLGSAASSPKAGDLKICMSDLFSWRKSVQTFTFAVASAIFSALASATASSESRSGLSAFKTSSKGSSKPSTSLAAASAASMEAVSSWTITTIFSCCSFFIFSTASFRSNSFCLAALTASRRAFTASRTFSHSVRRLSAFAPVLGNSALQRSISSFWNSSKFSDVAPRIFWKALRMLRTATCSSCFLLSSSCLARFASSIFLR
mmetsp:Transcript_19764/g.42855  ORF Transcript_19764/g.42855 Transcript_19764/m.42855 type:complete len:240 (+) Transcript_19764:1197-1916(+)